MKTKTYRNGRTTFRAYLKDCGNGYEVGFVCGPKTLFVGNFIHTSEANRWYSVMNTEIRKFSKRFTVGKKFPMQWFTHFISSHLYKTYYSFVGKVLPTHNRRYTTAWNQNVRKYKSLSRNWHTGEKKRALKTA